MLLGGAEAHLVAPQLADANMPVLLGPLIEQPWGLREFAVLDDDGNMIKFGELSST